MRSLNFSKENQILSLSIRPGFYQTKQDNYSLSKNGYLILEFNQVNNQVEQQVTNESESKGVEQSNKRTFIVTAKNVGDIMSLDLAQPYKKETDDEGSFIQYQARDTEPVKILKFNKLPEKLFKFTYCEIEGSNVTNNTSIVLTYGDVMTIQSLVQFSVPYLIGWHVLQNPALVESK